MGNKNSIQPNNLQNLRHARGSIGDGEAVPGIAS